MIKIITIFIFSMILFSCNKETPPRERTQTQNNESTGNNDSSSDTDTTMTVEEVFSSSLVQDIMGENDDDDLQFYLEDQIYPLVSKSDKVTLDRISSSLYLLHYEQAGVKKNFIIQKFYNPVKDEFVFEKTETETDAARQFVK